MQPTSPRGPGLAALLLAFVAGALGGAAAALLLAPHGPAADGSENAELRHAIAALDESVRALGSQLEGLSRTSPAPAPSPQQPLAPSGEDHAIRDLIDVAMVLGRLEDIAKLLEARIGQATSAFPGSSPLPLLDATRTPADRSALIALATEENDQRQVWKRHAFWTCQQVLDAYGLPDQIETGDGSMGWYYDTGERTVHFVFYEGMLVNFWN